MRFKNAVLAAALLTAAGASSGRAQDRPAGAARGISCGGGCIAWDDLPSVYPADPAPDVAGFDGGAPFFGLSAYTWNGVGWGGSGYNIGGAYDAPLGRGAQRGSGLKGGGHRGGGELERAGGGLHSRGARAGGRGR